MKLLLTSAGITNAEISRHLQDLAGKPSSELAFVFVPTAANPSMDDKGWLLENLVEFRAQGFRTFDMLDIAGLPSKMWEEHLARADVICFGGGEETYLSEIIVQQGIQPFLENMFAKDKVYMGISAGSIVAGLPPPEGINIELYGDEYHNGSGVIGMGFYNFSFLPHLNSEYFPAVRKENLSTYASRFRNTTYAVDDDTAIKINGESVEIIGGGDLWKLEK